MTEKRSNNLIMIVHRVACLLDIRLRRIDVIRISKSLGRLEHFAKYRGDNGVKLWKSEADSVVRWLLKAQIPKEWVFPHHLLWVKRHKKVGAHMIFSLTVLSFHRYFQGGHSIDITTITKPLTSDGSLAYELMAIKWIGVDRQLAPVREAKPFQSGPLEFNLMRSGPNGRPGWALAREDLKAILHGGLWEPLDKFLKLTTKGNSMAYQSVQKLRQLCETTERRKGYGKTRKGFKKSEPITSRLVRLGDKSGKTRVIAIGDMWSQMVLRPFHDWIFAFLRTLPRDGTFNQDRLRDQVQEWSAEGRKLFSYDLTAATDRFPVRFQAEVLQALGFLDDDSKEPWLKLMTDRSFLWSFKNRRGRECNKFVRYSVGQPMGLYSSWAALAISHHAVVWLSARMAGLETDPWLCDYAILGDDIVIADEKVANWYLTIMASLGLEINLKKSWVGYGVAEFAKSLYLRGQRVSSLPLEPLKLSREHFFTDVTLILEDLGRRGLEVSSSSVMGSFRPYPQKLTKRLLKTVTCPCLPSYFDCGGTYWGRTPEWWRFVVSYCRSWEERVEFLESIPSWISLSSSWRPEPLSSFPGSPLAIYKGKLQVWKGAVAWGAYQAHQGEFSKPLWGLGDNFVFWSNDFHYLGVSPDDGRPISLPREEDLYGETEERTNRESVLRWAFHISRLLQDTDISHDAAWWVIRGLPLLRKPRDVVSTGAMSRKKRRVTSEKMPDHHMVEWLTRAGYTYLF